MTTMIAITAPFARDFPLLVLLPDEIVRASTRGKPADSRARARGSTFLYMIL